MRKQQILKELEKEKQNNENLKEEIARLKALFEAELQAKPLVIAPMGNANTLKKNIIFMMQLCRN